MKRNSGLSSPEVALRDTGQCLSFLSILYFLYHVIGNHFHDPFISADHRGQFARKTPQTLTAIRRKNRAQKFRKKLYVV
jgi:hypothetical protein